MNQDTTHDQFIRLSDIAIVFIKHLKLWVGLLLIGFIVTVYLCYKHVNVYTQLFEIVPPNYIDKQLSKDSFKINQYTSNIISNTKFYKFSDDAFLQYKPSNNNFFINKTSNKNEYILVSHKKNEANRDVNDFINSLKKQPSYINLVKAWQDKIKNQISDLEVNLASYSKYFTLFQRTFNKVAANNDSSSKSLTEMGNTFLDYQKFITGTKNKIISLKDELRSFSPLSINYEKISGIKAKGPSQKIILILGVLLTLFLASIAIFMVEFVSNLILEVKQKLA